MKNLKIVQSATEPSKDNLWVSGKYLKIFTEDGWRDITGKTLSLLPSNSLYVAKNGDDANTGAVDSPLASIQTAITRANVGTVVFIGPGSYTEDITFKSGVYLSSTIKFGVTIIGNHTANYSGTVVLDNIILSGNNGTATLTISGTSASNLQFIGCSIYSTIGTAINYTNTNAASKLYIEDSTVVVSNVNDATYAFISGSTSAGSVIANRTTFRISNAAKVCLKINGAISFTHTSDIVYGGIQVLSTGSYVGQLVALTATGRACIDTSSTGTSVLFACTLATDVTAIQGAGVFLFSALTYGSTGVGGASTLNGGVGAISLPLSALAFRQAPLKASPQDGLLEYDGSDLYFTKGATRYKVSLTAI